MSVHIGEKSALAMFRKSHYLELNPKEITLFGKATEKLPKWFTDCPWEQKPKYHQSNFLPQALNMVDFAVGNFSINISGSVRALMECLYLARGEQSLVECYDLMEGLNNLSPGTVQTVLEECRSIKVKRFFLFLAEKSDHQLFKYLKHDKIDLGSGKRSVVPNGVYIPKYEITLPKTLVKNEHEI